MCTGCVFSELLIYIIVSMTYVYVIVINAIECRNCTNCVSDKLIKNIFNILTQQCNAYKLKL